MGDFFQLSPMQCSLGCFGVSLSLSVDTVNKISGMGLDGEEVPACKAKL